MGDHRPGPAGAPGSHRRLGFPHEVARRLSAYRGAITAARAAYYAGDLESCFSLLERAHILGQPWVVPHTVSHWLMLKVGWRKRDAREVRGQLLRLAAGGLLSLVGWLPEGNTGGADVSPVEPMPLPADLLLLCGAR